ncbi:hypothetical protein TNIN_220821 [Trichonephila inaurata madagascariensis]|uniref:Uncharacterized protein n=1 Tax=Trichonephila inaurata madagascariensis TaxID=2747483 RepID=A0A8X6YCQ1_9ARAC|nr:hypothetical protein TNIN_220821 [Trichonephila inaurata madagascariensis]
MLMVTFRCVNVVLSPTCFKALPERKEMKCRNSLSQLVFSTVRAEMAVRQLYETAFDSTASPADVDEDPGGHPGDKPTAL